VDAGGPVKVTIGAERFDSEDAQRLIEALDAHLSSRYSPDQRFGPNLKPAHLAPGLGTFLVARADGIAVGCGAVRRLDEETFEVKRMYVEPAVRGQGVAKEILSRLEADALALGARRLVLETGTLQTEAIGLYRRAGYRPIDCWGEYAASATSFCFEKRI
jgi:putative acetyltransferase